ncbi:MAG: HEAT repeat domain-containing protein, partial [Planctomycetota bacterium]
LIEQPLDDELRLRAFDFHAEGLEDDEVELYRRLWHEGGSKQVDEALERGEDPRITRGLISVRRRAFVAVAPHLSDDDLLRALGGFSATIRRTALAELRDRGHPQVLEAAERMFMTRNEFPQNRILGAEILLAHDAEAWLEPLVEEGTRRGAGQDARLGLAVLIRRHGNEDLYDDLVRKLTRGQDHETVFRIHALTDFEDDRYQTKLEKLLRDRSSAIRAAAIASLAEREGGGAVEALEKALKRSDSHAEQARMLRSMHAVRGGDPEWVEALVEYTRDERREVRNAALALVAQLEEPDPLEVLLEAIDHPDWSTRQRVYSALAERGDSAAVAAMVGRTRAESGRLLADLEAYLWRLTGKPFGRSGRSWEAWWSAEGQGFEVMEEEELRKLEGERERRRLEEQSSAPDLFGVRIESNAVSLVIDVSGSMVEPTRTPIRGERGPQRITVAVDEIERAINSLVPTAAFNVIAFSDRVFPFAKQAQPADPATKAEALEFVHDLRVTGGTNLHGALVTAFDDPAVDTVIVISDGDPSMGAVIDPFALRRVVADWNAERELVIHTIQIGATLPILTWLSEDSGGSSVTIP